MRMTPNINFIVFDLSINNLKNKVLITNIIAINNDDV